MTITVDVSEGITGAARYSSVPSFLSIRDLEVDVAGLGTITVDVAYGGAFYALASLAGWKLDERPVAHLAATGTAITAAVNATADVRHPDSDDLGFLSGTIITDGVTGATSTNVCVFAGAQVDRSPNGSGVQARLAAEFERGTVQLGELRRFRSIVGSEFTGRVIDTTAVGDATAVIVEVGGRAFYTGESRFTIEDDDDLGGFTVS